MPVPASAKRAAIITAALLLSAPAASAALSSAAPAPPPLSDGLLRIELVIPPEPEVHPTYPVATLDQPAADEFKVPPRAPHWGYGFPGIEEGAMWAEPHGASAKLERFSVSIDDENWRRSDEWKQPDNSQRQPVALNDWHLTPRSGGNPSERPGRYLREPTYPDALPELHSSFEPASGYLEE